jgi:ParB family chromosome partitioning protein
LDSTEPNVSRGTNPDIGSDVEEPDRELVPVPGTRFAEVPVGSIRPNAKQPRTVFDEEDMDELVHSIREIGILQPVVVRPHPDGSTDYELVMGERRWRASQAAGLETIPAIIRDTADDDLLRDALLENLHRSELNPLEEGAAYQQLLNEFGCTQEELSLRIGRSRPQISNTIRLLKLPAIVQMKVAAGSLSAGHARALLSLKDSTRIVDVAQRVINEGLSVRSTEELVSQLDGKSTLPPRRTKTETPRHERLDYLATSLSDRLDTNVKITLGARKGKVQIDFASVEDLNRIMDILASE